MVKLWPLTVRQLRILHPFTDISMGISGQDITMNEMMECGGLTTHFKMAEEFTMPKVGTQMACWYIWVAQLCQQMEELAGNQSIMIHTPAIRWLKNIFQGLPHHLDEAICNVGRYDSCYALRRGLYLIWCVKGAGASYRYQGKVPGIRDFAVSQNECKVMRIFSINLLAVLVILLGSMQFHQIQVKVQ